MRLSNLYLLHQQLLLTLTFKIYPEFSLSQPLLLPPQSGRLHFAQIIVKASQWSPQFPPCSFDSQLPWLCPMPPLFTLLCWLLSQARRPHPRLGDPRRAGCISSCAPSSAFSGHSGPLACAGADQAIPMSSLRTCCILTWGHSPDTCLTHYLTFEVSTQVPPFE